ncbi:MAG TPA: sensor histidine kinase [Cellulomonadaceae bacterium]|nr:sensor histidine kinase [Cellulomonadaceae bacterium]
MTAETHRSCSVRTGFWVRSLRGWDLTFYGMSAISAVTLVLVSTGARSLTIGLAALAGMVAAYVTLGRRGALRGDHRLTTAYLAVMMVAVTVAVRSSTVGTLLLFIGFSHIWFFAETRRGGIVACTVLTLAVGVALLVEGDVPTDQLGPVAGQLAVSLVFAIMLGLWITLVSERSEERAELLERLEATQHELAAAHRAEGVTAERARVAQEIHDTLAQGFASIVMLAQTVTADVARADTDAATRRLALIEETARENLAEARGLVAAFSPVALDGGDLADALDRLARRVGVETGLTVVVDVDRAATAHLRRADEVVLLRAAQEALTNVRRHAHATTVRVTVTEDRDMVRLGVHDDGVGISAGSAEGYGLRGMRSRVDAVAGQMSVRAGDGGGTALDVTVRAVAR